MNNEQTDAEREAVLRMLAGNPVAKRILERGLQLEDEAIARENTNPPQYPWPGFEWHQVPAQPQVLNRLVADGLLVTGGLRGTFKSNNSTTYKLRNPELIRECLVKLNELADGTEEGEIPTDLFDFILGYDDIKSLFWRSIRSPYPVHLLMVGPPATAKSMFLGELARLPFSRFTLGGGTSKAGLADFLLEFRPRYLIIDEIDKMALADMSILLSLMEGGVVARLKKRMREEDRMTTWVFASANRDAHIWPELKSRFFTIRFEMYSEDDFIAIARTVLINREKVESALAEHIAQIVARHSRDVRLAIHFGRLCSTVQEVNQLAKMQWPE